MPRLSETNSKSSTAQQKVNVSESGGKVCFRQLKLAEHVSQSREELPASPTSIPPTLSISLRPSESYLQACTCQIAIQKKNQEAGLTFGFWLQEPRKATVQSLGTVLSRLMGQRTNLTDTWSQQNPRSHCVENELGGDGGIRGTEKTWVAIVVAQGSGNDWGLSQVMETMTGGHSPVEREEDSRSVF